MAELDEIFAYEHPPLSNGMTEDYDPFDFYNPAVDDDEFYKFMSDVDLEQLSDDELQSLYELYLDRTELIDPVHAQPVASLTFSEVKIKTYIGNRYNVN